MSGYLIRVTRHFYGGTLNVREVDYIGEHGFDPLAPLTPFGSREEARAEIERLESATYWLSHGEYAAPTYRAIKLAAAPKGVRERAEWRCRVCEVAAC